jgi:hypothetical protein
MRVPQRRSSRSICIQMTQLLDYWLRVLIVPGDVYVTSWHCQRATRRLSRVWSDKAPNCASRCLQGSVIVADINAEMLAEGRSRAVTRGFGTHSLSLHKQPVRVISSYCQVLQIASVVSLVSCRRRCRAQLAASGCNGAAL